MKSTESHLGREEGESERASEGRVKAGYLVRLRSRGGGSEGGLASIVWYWGDVDTTDRKHADKAGEEEEDGRERWGKHETCYEGK